ncbi:hypothetical protein FRX31_014398 [Thalictrum thalictroides]|uniref:Uncharacterized protein n=1 Tax=Thalictrum thalictroides TaxID=46969 RepID=A0A7J6WHV6_THATH|nr:hypothetical protein FRX31_014398 [Thalictrum thalictroides]
MLRLRSEKSFGDDKKESNELTPLKYPIEGVYRRIKDRGTFTKQIPLPQDTEGKRNKSKKWDHHDDYGHDLSTCRALKYEIQLLADARLIPI